MTKSTVFLPLGLDTRTSTRALGIVSQTGRLLTIAAPWVAGGSIVLNVVVNKQITAEDVYQSIIMGALLLEGGTYYLRDKSISDNINLHLNSRVIYSWK